MSAALSFSTSEIIRTSWKILQDKWLFLLGVWATVLGVTMVGGLIQSAVMQVNEGLGGLINLALQVLSLWLSIGTTTIILKTVRGQSAELSELFAGSKFMWQYFLASLVVGLVVGFGSLLLIVPGIIFAIQYGFTLFYVVDEGLSFSEAMGKSKALTQGNVWQLFVFGLALFGLNLLGLLALGVGILVTAPLSSLAYYVLFAHLKQQKDAEMMPVQQPVAVVQPSEVPVA